VASVVRLKLTVSRRRRRARVLVEAAKAALLDSTKIPVSTLSLEILEGTATTILVVLVALGSSKVAVFGVLGGGPVGVVGVGPRVVGLNELLPFDFFLELPLLPFDDFFLELLLPPR